MIKKILKSFTFYFLLLSLAIIYMNYIGQDSHEIILIGLNIILNKLASMDAARDFMNSGPMINSKTVGGGTCLYWYLAHFISFAFYGLILDGIKAALNKGSKKVFGR
ncbi:MAG: hypothetical protein N2484_08315 [Clostridia bacterium]|nr:hypothetical protein [Clostridia bacterium]